MTGFRRGKTASASPCLPAGALVLLLATSLCLSACGARNAKLEENSFTTGSTAPPPLGKPTGPIDPNAPSYRRTADLAERWKANPKDVDLGLSYADNLGQLGQNEQQLHVYDTLVVANPNDLRIKQIFGRRLLKLGRPDAAITMLEPAAATGTDFKTLSALGSAYDQNSDHAKAQATYAKALILKPQDLATLNNLGMSYALSGNLNDAEKTLRMAMNLPNAKSIPRIRQNLALVVGLEGRYDEAKQIASADLSPDQVEANMNYLQTMMSQPNTWKQLAKDGAS